MRDSWTLLDGANRRRTVALAFAPIVMLMAVGVGAVVVGQDSGDGVLLTAAGPGQPVNEPVATTPASSVPDATTVPVPETSVTVPPRPAVTTEPVGPDARSVPPSAAGAPVADESTSDSGQAHVTLANEFSSPVVVKVNGQSYSLAAGQHLPVTVTPAASGNDVIEVGLASDPMCGVGDAQGYFRAGQSYVLTVRVSPGNCLGAPSPDFAITSA